MKKVLICLGVVLSIISIAAISCYLCVKPKISLKGSEKIKLHLNDKYIEEGASVSLLNLDMGDNYSIKGNVDTSKVGTYTIYYESNIKYLKDKASTKRIVEVIDSSAPEVILSGSEEITLMEGEQYNELGFSANDDNDGNITNKVIIDNKVNTNIPGKYEITYKVVDSSGNETTKKRIINVTEKPKPVKVSNSNSNKTSNITSNKVIKKSNTNKESTNTLTKKNNSGSGKGLPILMYHYFYDKNNPPKDKKLNSNYMEIHSFEEQMKYLHDAGYYFPTWDEVADFVDGKITLPSKSVVVTVDDGQKSFFDLAIPVLQKYNVNATSFIITSKSWSVSQISKYNNSVINFQSHTHDMHHGGCKGGHGGLFRCINHDKGVADLNKSIQILGKKDVIAYPYGDVTDNTLSITKEAGFKVGVTTVNARAKKGMDKLQLPRVRMSRGVSLSTFKGMV